MGFRSMLCRARILLGETGGYLEDVRSGAWVPDGGELVSLRLQRAGEVFGHRGT